MTTVHETLALPGGVPPRSVTVTVFLAGEGGEPYPAGSVLADDVTIVQNRKVKPDKDGVWSVDLVPNASIEPEGTVWGIILTSTIPGLDDDPRFIEVPASGSNLQVQDLLTDPPGALMPSAVAVAIAQLQAELDALEVSIPETYSPDRLLRAFELVPMAIYGNSYAQGGDDGAAGSLYMDRVASRLRTRTPTNYGAGGLRSDQILGRVETNWVPNTRGIVALAELYINDVTAYGNAGGAVTTAANFRSMLALWAAQRIATAEDTEVLFGPGWSLGASSTIGSYADVAFQGDVAYLRVGYVTGAGGTLEVRNTAGTLVATITTGGYNQNFTGTVRIAGFGAGPHTVRVTLTAGSATLIGIAVPGDTPGVVLWHQPGERGISPTFDNLFPVYAAACEAVLSEFDIEVIPVPVGPDWDKDTMLGPTWHPNDFGNSYIADLLIAALSDHAFTQGLNQLLAATASGTYTVPSLAYTSPGATVPAQVTGLAATAGAQINLAWNKATDGGASLTGYLIERSPAGAGTWTTVVTLTDPRAVSYVIQSGLTAATSYDFRVSAINSIGTGTPSATSTATAGAAPTVYSLDTFTRADALVPGTTETGGFAWTSTAGSAHKIASNRLAVLTVSAPTDCWIDDGQANGTIRATVVNGTQFGGIVARTSGTGTGSGANAIVLYHDASNWLLRRRTNGSYTTLGTGPAPAANDVVELVLNGTSVKARVNGVEFASVTEAQGSTNTKHGVMAHTTATAQFDNWLHNSSLV